MLKKKKPQFKNLLIELKIQETLLGLKMKAPTGEK